MIPTSLKDAWFSDDCHKYFHDVMPNNLTKGSKCADHFNEMIALTSGAGLNWYDLYRQATPGGLMASHEESDADRMAHSWVAGEKKTYKRGYT